MLYQIMDDQLSQIKQIPMKLQEIEKAFQKVNHKLLAELEPDEKQQAIDEFKQLYEDQMIRVEDKLNRRFKVKLNLQQQDEIEKQMINSIETQLKAKMESHIRKRKSMQLQKIKNYQNLQRAWKDKMKQITEQNKKQQLQNIKKASTMQKQAENFWKHKTQSLQEEQTQSRASKRYQSAKIPGERSHFITESYQVPQDTTNTKHKIKEKGYQQFLPIIDHQKGSKIWERGSKSVSKQNAKNEVIKQHLIKSNEQWKEKEDHNFQKAMDKLNKIMQRRTKVKLKVNQQMKTAKQNRQMRERSVVKIEQEPVNIHSNTVGHAYMYQTSNKKIEVNIVNNSKVKKSPSAQIRHQQLQKQSFDERTRQFQQQKKKMRRDNFHLMVKQAVNLVKLQALRHKK